MIRRRRKTSSCALLEKMRRGEIKSYLRLKRHSYPLRLSNFFLEKTRFASCRTKDEGWLGVFTVKKFFSGFCVYWSRETFVKNCNKRKQRDWWNIWKKTLQRTSECFGRKRNHSRCISRVEKWSLIKSSRIRRWSDHWTCRAPPRKLRKLTYPRVSLMDSPLDH